MFLLSTNNNFNSNFNSGSNGSNNSSGVIRVYFPVENKRYKSSRILESLI